MPLTQERLAHAPWQYSRLNSDEELQQALDWLQRVKRSGFTAVVLGNTSQLAQPGLAGTAYQERLRRLGDEARRLGLGIIPMVMNFGDGGAIFPYDPNLAEGLPVRDALFVVRGREADVVDDPPLVIENPGFEGAQNHLFPAWTDEKGLAGTAVYADWQVRHGQEASLRVEFSAAPGPWGWAWITQKLRVRPFRLYDITVWIKSEDLPPDREPAVSLWTGRRHLHYRTIGVRSTQDWTEHHIVFNSLDNDVIDLRVGSEGGTCRGRAWFDDLSVRELGMLNILRRPGCPLMVRGEDGTVYEEGRDYEPVADPLLYRATAWGGWDFTHRAPTLRLTPDSRLRDGQRLRVSFYHAMAIYWGQVSVCLSCPGAYELFERGVAELAAILHPVGYHISVGEIRTANWDGDCAPRGMTPAQLLVDSIKRRIQIARTYTPGARLYAWSDMLDPWHNGVDNYYLCNGSWAGAAADTPRDIVIVNWNYTGHEGQSPRYFADLGFHQLLLGDLSQVRAWLHNNPDVPGIQGLYALEAENPEDWCDSAGSGS